MVTSATVGLIIALFTSMDEKTATNDLPETLVRDMRECPQSYYPTPRDLLRTTLLSRGDIRIALERWELDERERLRATEENMAGGPPNRLREVRLCLEELEA